MSSPDSEIIGRAGPYAGFEQGPIRPPSEARSLLVRVTRNCPWNRCTFCPVYKGSRFSLRPIGHVKRDIDRVYREVRRLQGDGDDAEAASVAGGASGMGDPVAFHAALSWRRAGMRSIFLQDANSLIVPPSDLIEILIHLRKRFPSVERITSYARSHTVARIPDADLKRMSAAGLNRIHIGMESGSDRVLEMVKKGVDKETQIKAGRKIKDAGMELSEYVMPGLGGRRLSEAHALETADALNKIGPDFIRLRTLAIPKTTELYRERVEGRFEKCTDLETAAEILRFIEALEGIASTLKSDHILNLFEEIEGVLPEDKEKMTGTLRCFLEMDPDRRTLYQVGRRLGFFSRLDDIDCRPRFARAEEACRELGITPENAEAVIETLMNRFV